MTWCQQRSYFLQTRDHSCIVTTWQMYRVLWGDDVWFKDTVMWMSGTRGGECSSPVWCQQPVCTPDNNVAQEEFKESTPRLSATQLLTPFAVILHVSTLPCNNAHIYSTNISHVLAHVFAFRVKLNDKLSPKRSPVVTGSLEFTWLVVGIIHWPGNPQLTFGHWGINNHHLWDEARSVSPSSDDIRLMLRIVWFMVSWKCTNKVKQSTK